MGPCKNIPLKFVPKWPLIYGAKFQNCFIKFETSFLDFAQFVPLCCTKNSSKSIRFFSDAWNFITPINQFAKRRETRTEIEKKQIKIKKKARCFKSFFFLPFSTFSPTNANNTHIIGFFFNIKETKTNIKSQNLCYHFDHFWTFLGKQIFPR